MNKLEPEGDLREVGLLVDSIKPLLSGKSSVIVGTALANLLAIWLAEHHVEGDPEATRNLRALALALHIATVYPLIEVNARIMGIE